jgi:hypothetical protein
LANNSIKISALNAQTAPASTDYFVVVSNTSGNAETMYVTANNLLNNTAANIATNILTCNNIVVTGNSAPANNTDSGTRVAGSIWGDGNYLYFFDGAQIKRITLNTF